MAQGGTVFLKKASPFLIPNSPHTFSCVSSPHVSRHHRCWRRRSLPCHHRSARDRKLSDHYKVATFDL
uniref:Uncharacterized protein n=1 Tax=Arundo donax TaxID=35708 RepID=A0A0A9GJR5_ARUDO